MGRRANLIHMFVTFHYCEQGEANISTVKLRGVDSLTLPDVTGAWDTTTTTTTTVILFHVGLLASP